jgi:CubicO group peptidase (beta-lactamase class C family)
MNRLIACCSLALLIVVLLVENVSAQSREIPVAEPSEVGMSAEKLARVDAAMQELIEQNRIPGGIVMIARHGKVVHLQAYGKMDLASDKPMTPDAIMRFYSMSKAITTAAALMLYDEGKLDVNDPVSKYLPELKGATVAQGDEAKPTTLEMTIADLMRHTAGYSYGAGKQKLHNDAYRELNLLDRSQTLATMQSKLGKLPLDFEPSTDWEYGISIDILGRVIEVVSGETLDDFFRERIFMPLDMRDTAFYVPQEKVARFATNYNSDGKGKLTIGDAPDKSQYLTKPAFYGGGGGLVSTARDYMRFLLMIASEGEFQGARLLKPETVKLMTTNQVPKEVGWIKFGDVREGVGFGYGFSVRVEMSDWDPEGRVGEYGWGGAASTHYWVSPKDDLAVITLEQIMPYSFETEFRLKGLIYDAIED